MRNILVNLAYNKVKKENTNLAYNKVNTRRFYLFKKIYYCNNIFLQMDS